VARLIVAATGLGSLFSLAALISRISLAAARVGLLPTLYLRFMRRAVVTTLILLCHTTCIGASIREVGCLSHAAAYG
jgi:hypothetical protein